MVEVTETEACLVRAHREACRLGVGLVANPFDEALLRQLESSLPQLQEAADTFRTLCGEAPGLPARIVRLSQLAVDERPAEAA
ncbi:hypothetical protein ACFC1B_06730 [Streptomyces xiamenensis]|uniref:hypothetical protein n=1 Tax=Streptomyces xiamenensis TaxID=408015 RepID=UPI0035DF86BD